tara:strand:- start:7524 stop:8444 length:921 start_codon:yes stop_codon:yes gene_type:complete
MSNNRHSIVLEFLDYIQNVKRYSIHTYRSYAFDLNDYVEFCKTSYPNKKIIELKQESVREYLQYSSKKGLNAKTLARRLASIKSLYRYLMNRKIVDINITQGVSTPKIKKELPHYLSQNQIKQIMMIPSGEDKISLRDRLILELFYATGIRISELVAIRFKDIRLEEGIIYIMGKRNKERVVMIGGESQSVLRAYRIFLHNERLDAPDNYLFPAMRKNKKGIIGHLSISSVFNIVKKYLRQVSNDEKLSPHSLRHTFATHMLSNGAGLMAIKDLLGHSSLSSTQVYTHVQPEKLKENYKNSHPHGK